MSDTDTDPNVDTSDDTDQTSTPSPAPTRQPAPMRTGYLRQEGPVQPMPEPTDVDQIPFGYRRMERSGVGPYNPYIPTGQNPLLSNRPAVEWGRQDWVERSMDDGVTDGLHTPREQDLPAVYHHVTTQVGQWAPPSIAMPAIAGGRFYGTAMQMYANNMVQQGNMSRQNAEASYKITALRLKEYLGKIGRLYIAYGASDDGKDPGEPNRLHEELWDLAQEYGDRKLQAMLERGDYGAVDKLARHLDSNLSDLNKAIKTQELGIKTEERKAKEEKNRREEAERQKWFGGTPSATEAEPGAAPPKPAPTPRQPSVSSETVDTAAPAAPPLAPKMIEDAARGMQDGTKQEKDLPKDQEIRDAVNNKRQELDDYMRKIAANKSMSPEDKMSAIRARNPGMGDLVDGLRSGRTELTATDSDKPQNRLATTLLGSMNPDWKRTAEQERRQRQHLDDQAQISGIRQTLGMQEKVHANIAETVVKNANDMERLIKLGDRLKQKGIETGVPITDGYMRELRRRWLGDPDVSAFDAQLAIVRSDVGRILSAGTGGASGAVYPVSAQKEMREFYDVGITMPQLRAMTGVIKNDYATKLAPVVDQINGLHGRIAQILGVPVRPGELINDDKIIKALTAEETKTIGDKTYYKRDGDWHDE